MSLRLNDQEYQFRNICFGLAGAHWNQADQESGWLWFCHTVVAICEAIPLIGQIVAAIEIMAATTIWRGTPILFEQDHIYELPKLDHDPVCERIVHVQIYLGDKTWGRVSVATSKNVKLSKLFNYLHSNCLPDKPRKELRFYFAPGWQWSEVTEDELDSPLLIHMVTRRGQFLICDPSQVDPHSIQVLKY